MEKLVPNEALLGQICDELGFDVVAEQLGLTEEWNNYYTMFMSLTNESNISGSELQGIFRSMLVDRMKYSPLFQ